MTDVEKVDSIVDIQLKEAELALERVKAKWEQHRESLTPIINALTKVGLEPSFGSYSLDLCFTGDAKKLASVVRILMHAGYRTKKDKPKKGDTSWTAFWTAEGMYSIWMNFSSSVCRRVKVGTQLVEQDIYEVRCGDESELALPSVESPEVPDDLL